MTCCQSKVGLATILSFKEQNVSDEPKPSWLEPQLELKDFQLGSARDLFHFSSELEIDWKTSWNFISQLNTYFLIIVYLKLTKLCIWIKLFTFKKTQKFR